MSVIHEQNIQLFYELVDELSRSGGMKSINKLCEFAGLDKYPCRHCRSIMYFVYDDCVVCGNSRYTYNKPELRVV